jgi:hypothetical protein
MTLAIVLVIIGAILAVSFSVAVAVATFVSSDGDDPYDGIL